MSCFTLESVKNYAELLTWQLHKAHKRIAELEVEEQIAEEQIARAKWETDIASFGQESVEDNTAPHTINPVQK